MDLWDHYNNLLISEDISRIQKMFARYELFRKTIDVPGDILECGVFKGAGFFFWLKLLVINNLHYSKKVIGFDTFSGFSDNISDKEEKSVSKYVKETNFKGTSIDFLKEISSKISPNSNYEFVEGDIVSTAKKYVKDNYGFKISLLNLDLDTKNGTLAALEHFYPMMTKGGIIIFDEYAARGWGETDAVDFFIKKHSLSIEIVKNTKTPSAYIIID